MENQYGVPVINKFQSLIDDDEDPLEILRLKEEERLKKSAEKLKGKNERNDPKTAKNKQNKKILTPVQEQKGKQPEQAPSKREEKSAKTRQRQENEGARNRPAPKDRENVERPPRRERKDFEPRGFGGERSTGFGDKQDRSERQTERADFGGGYSRGERSFDRGGPRGARRGARGGRGGRGGFGERTEGGAPAGDRPFSGKREFERRSGSDRTGVKAVDKRDGSGAHNWGTIRDDMDGQLNNISASEDKQDWSAQSDDAETPQTTTETEEGEETTVPEEQGPSEMTLDEWKAKQSTARVNRDFNIRRAGEGCDSSQWKKTYILKKKEEEEGSSDEYESEEEDTHGRSKNLLNIEINFYDAPGRGRGGRGGRGRGASGRGAGGPGRFPRGGGSPRGAANPRGGNGGRGGFRGGSGSAGGGRGGRREQAPNVDNEQEFPSLGAS